MLTKLLNQKGATLIEALLSLFLFSIIGTAVYFVLLNGVKTENKIYTETMIRDEADLVMSQIIDVLYTAPASKVKDVSTGSQNLLVYQDESQTTSVGFAGHKPVIDGKAISTNDFDFKDSTIIKADNSIKIVLNIKSKKNKNARPLSLQSQFGLMKE
ncbi:PulJ/GspJ family protein [Fictibacillus sp. BK138]|uniref:PulJ/GspJ family protein n=1 Tax=Fictibacillus sp. BK138 TaxID=2512121 RepID=UPI00102A7525|nr:prepilin-type N-terminal cleavage/methylation domain-containing protein [Fictibacillus sp. BK138]RZT21578.1 pilin/secretion family protein with methylation motif [Fictibacillus sp. BK138]